jgi:GT2 family glycosyltransferase/glycosyltransferase involved in cell wall biosynthesis
VAVSVSIIIPIFNKLAFTRQCLDRIARHATEALPYEVIVVDNGSTDGSAEYLRDLSARDARVRYVRNATNLGFSRGNNVGARTAGGKYLLFLNNDTIVQAGWLEAMVRIAASNHRVGIVGIKQLFPYTNTIHHTGIIFTADRTPQHLYPHADASLPYVNKQREYQAVTGSCLLISRDLFVACGMFDEEYVNGYEDVDLCLTVRQRDRTVVCCTSAFIYHYGQITETRTADDDKNAARFKAKWADRIQPDELTYFHQDQREIERGRKSAAPIVAPRAAESQIYFADDLSSGSALTWVTTELVLALAQLDAPVTIKQTTLPASIETSKRRDLERRMLAAQPSGGIQIKWSHYWPQHLGLDLDGAVNLELFVINYLFDRRGRQPWDYWLQSLVQNRYGKLPLSGFCRDVLLQTGVSEDTCHILRPGYSPEVERVAAPPRKSPAFRLLTVTNSHDLERYGTKVLLDAYWRAFRSSDDVVLVLKDYGATSGNTTLPKLLREHAGRARVEYITNFTSKDALIELYKSCDAFVSAHRGEGYGMKILDALACGLPVVTPLFGGPTDFCTPTNCLPVNFSLVPVGDCLDTRSLNITNSPRWAEPDVDSLVGQLRAVVEHQDEARRIGEQARRDVTGVFTWAAAARQFADFLKSIERKPATPAPVGPPTPRTERSPYWMGVRISVIVPTHNRRASLRKCLHALEQQTILPQEFEVIVVDDGSTDDTRAMVESESFPFTVKYHYQENQGPGTARNQGIRQAQGELVLFIGDDIIAHERMLEEHLLAHATRPSPGASVLGHIDWPPDMRPNGVMNFVCGESSLQFAYVHIPHLSALDFRFFYTSNISLKRQFLVDAAADGIGFDRDFRYAAFEDSELAFRLERRGLQIHYRKDALAYHDHWMDIDGFARREYLAGQMAVVFYRKHPQIDEQLKVRWIGDWTEQVDRLADDPELQTKIRAFDAETDQFLRSLARSLEELIALQPDHSRDVAFSGPTFDDAAFTKTLNGILTVIFDTARTRGKVEEWYSGVEDRERIDAAKALIGCVRKLEFLSAQPAELEKLRGTLNWMSFHVVGGLRQRVTDLEQQLGLTSNGRTRFLGLKPTAWRMARKTDLFIQQQLSTHERWLSQYQAMRVGLKRLIKPPSGRPPS